MCAIDVQINIAIPPKTPARMMRFIIRNSYWATIMGEEKKRGKAKLEAENVQPAYAEGFGVAGAHLSRRSESEGGTSDAPAGFRLQRRDERGRQVGLPEKYES
jgi:hypothetical protein